jgi:hypothetical protein
VRSGASPAVRSRRSTTARGTSLTQVSLPTLNWIDFPDLTPLCARGRTRQAPQLRDSGGRTRRPDGRRARRRRGRSAAAPTASSARTSACCASARATYRSPPQLALSSRRGLSNLHRRALHRRAGGGVPSCAPAPRSSPSDVRVALEFAPYGGPRTLADAALSVTPSAGIMRAPRRPWHFFRSGGPGRSWSLNRDQIALVTSTTLCRRWGTTGARAGTGGPPSAWAALRLAEFAAVLEELRGRAEHRCSPPICAAGRRRGAPGLQDSLTAVWPSGIRRVV